MRKRLLAIRGFSTCFIVAIVGLGLCRSILAQNGRCHQPTEALVSKDWHSIKAPHLQFEVMFSDPAGWTGLEHVFGKGERLNARWRTAIPFLAPAIVQSYDGSVTSTAIHNLSPIFYLHATDIASFFPVFDPEKVRLLRLTVRHDHRELAVSKGITSFTFAAGSPSHDLVPVEVTRLSQTLMELRPRSQLAPGPYLIAFGNQENEGFEFEISCNQ